jgi:autotransporter-associated beta strand protein
MSGIRYILALVVLAALCCVSAPAQAAPEDFETPEYDSSTGLRSLNASEAYDLGFTGKGVIVGVVDDSFAPQTGEFAGKYPLGTWEAGEGAGNDHGIHVTGIIGANRDGVGMHGAAFDAGLFPLTAIGRSNTGDRNLPVEAWTVLSGMDEIRIISNSWGTNVYPDQSLDFDTGQRYSDTYYGNLPSPIDDPDYLQTWLYEGEAELAGLALDMARADKLFVFAGGNEGHLSPGGEAVLPTLVKQYGDAGDARLLKLHWINVAAYDSRYVERNQNGEWTPNSPAFVAAFTNMGLYAKDYTLWAPGAQIYSTIASDRYGYKDGTSMATPYVSGVAALTQSAFPYMWGKQIADVLLSTATKFTYNNTPRVFLLDRDEYGDPDEDPLNPYKPDDPYTSLMGKVKLYYDSDRIGDLSYLSQEEISDMVSALAARGYGEEVAGQVVEDLIAAGGIAFANPDDYLELFGAGIVNAGKAVRGPGYFDANRMDNKDRYEHKNTFYALYPVDTRGFDSVWSNDIDVKPVDILQTDPDYLYVQDLDGLPVGLRKSGAGTLYLTGNNRYSGLTFVEGGGISLGRTGQADGAAQLAGDVLIGPAGMFAGNGYVAGDLESHGLLSPGLDSGPSDLTVRDDVTSDGTLLVHLWPEAGRANRLVVGGDLDLRGTMVDVVNMAGGDVLPSGRYAVIESNGLLNNPVNAEDEAMQGVTLLHTFRLDTEGNALYFSYAGTAVNPRAKALSEGFLGGVALINQSADLAAGAGLEDAAAAARSASGRAGTAYGISGFGAISGGFSRYHTGSHVDMKSLSLLTGLSIGRDLPSGFLALGAFVEFGSGSYDTWNSFGNAASVRGSGDTEYVGGGILGRMDFERSGPGRFHAEASARLGRVMTDYDGAGLRDHTGRFASYSSESPYYGLHAGLGYAREMTEKATLDLYGKYFWTRQEGDSVTLSTGDPVRFKSVDSHRLRAGARFAYTINEAVMPYLGAAYEYEFDGRVEATTNGFSLPRPSLRGGTGVGELGVTLKPAAASRPDLSLDIGVQGYTGKREGLTGSLRIKLEF